MFSSIYKRILLNTRLDHFLIGFIDNENYLLYYFNMSENIWASRWTKDQIKSMVLEQFQFFWNLQTGTIRTQLAQVEQARNVPHAVIVSGLRRVGKSTLLAQMAHRLGADEFYYVNFEDDRFLGFEADDANDLYQILVEVFGERKSLTGIYVCKISTIKTSGSILRCAAQQN